MPNNLSASLAPFGSTNSFAAGAQTSSSEISSESQYHKLAADSGSAESAVEGREAAVRTSQSNNIGRTPTAATGSAIQSSAPVAIASIQKWSGRIVEIDGDIFTAELTPLNQSGPAFFADLQLDDLDADDPGAVKEGDLFYLTITRIRSRGQRITKASNLLLRRFGKWSPEDITSGMQDASSEFAALEDYVD